MRDDFSQPEDYTVNTLWYYEDKWILFLVSSLRYRFSLLSLQLRLDASDMAGLHYGIMTFIQLLRFCHDSGIPPLHVSNQTGTDTQLSIYASI